ncbi:MAG: hypothetical protein CMD06_03690 [Flavobacteriales bacterium]|nr:hypothetical protein [Flavobacteriales bacterium]
MIKIKVIKNIIDFRSLKQEWDRLYNFSSSIFQSFTFNYYSWLYDLSLNSNNSLSIVVVKKGEIIQSIIPFYMDAKKRLRFINDNHIDFCDILVNNEFDCNLFFQLLNDKLDFKFIQLLNFKGESKVAKVFSQIQTKRKYLSSHTEYSVLNISKGDFPYNVLNYRSKQKHRINKMKKKFKDYEHQVLTVDKDHFPRNELERLKEIMIEKLDRKDFFLTNPTISLISKLYKNGEVILSVMSHKGKLISMSIILNRSENNFQFWIDLFDTVPMINIINYINFISYVSSFRDVSVSFGRGRYSYKESNFMPQFFSLYNCYIFNTTFDKYCYVIFDKIRFIFKLFYKKITS